MNGVKVTFLNIYELPEINTPCLIDCDLDGHEYGQPFGQIGGFYYHPDNNSELVQVTPDIVIQKAQKYIKIHPGVAARILRERIKNPLEIYIATERCYRHRAFWQMVEYDLSRTASHRLAECCCSFVHQAVLEHAQKFSTCAMWIGFQPPV